ncbi:hypothetical protein EV700_2785 [Fluviicoccus keumensis]|uniref:Uncharacterized protein n=1 Tax=Fluviicoccus keumensis TaxID=1435465 RepID=A0A4Q7YKY0_9GAMM|nr:DUF5691 domain-containing protein [Fluviicoccus keumensis]RZU38207.1 hypothetical protein EV700_2785 [Fluviicoccus keumensis]
MTDTLWQQLEVNTLLGSARATAVSDWPDALRGAVDSLPDRDGPRALLAQLALAMVWQRAGQTLPQSAAPDSAAPETHLRPLPAAARPWLQNALANDQQSFLPECLRAMAEHGFHPAATLLPDLLRLGESRKGWRLPLGQVAGARGVWLAAQNPEWRWLEGATFPLDADPGIRDRFWQDTAPAARELYLIRWRQQDPAAARDWLQQRWPDESATQRAQWLELCRHGLQADDAIWLESLLDDRSKQVREAALGLLARLDDSPWRQRLRERCAMLVNVKRGLLRKALEVTPPDALDPALQRDGLEPVTGGAQGLGEKAVWLRTIVAGAGCGWLLAHTGLDPENLLAAVAKTDWASPLQQGLAAAALTEGHAPMLLALLSPAGRKHRADDAPLLDALGAADREQALLDRVRHETKPGAGLQELNQLLARLTGWEWSEAFTRTLLGLLRPWLEHPSHEAQRMLLQGMGRQLAAHGHRRVAADPPPGTPPDMAAAWQGRHAFLTALEAG